MKDDCYHEMTITKSKFIILFNYRKHAKTVLVESYINNGTVDEKNVNLGISHLLEHVCLMVGKVVRINLVANTLNLKEL